jgi:G3E family GTPase
MNGRRRSERIPVAVLTGFLGSGKTTILRHLMQTHALSRTLVIINEFGEVGLDHHLVSHVDDDTVVALSSGCICCTIRGDLAETLARAPGRYARGGKRWFDRVIIETTGIADPAPILQTLLAEPAVLRHYAMARVLTTVDAVNGEAALAAYPEAVKQIGVADQLLITKTDLVAPAALAALRRSLEALAPIAQVKLIEHGVMSSAPFFSGGPWLLEAHSPDVATWLAEESRGDEPHTGQQVESHHNSHHHAPGHTHHGNHVHDVNRHGSIEASHLVFEEPIDAGALDRCMDALLAQHGEKLLRIKSIVNAIGFSKPLVLHGVQHIFHPPEVLEAWPDEDRRTQIVLISQGVGREVLVQFFANYGLTPSALSP